MPVNVRAVIGGDIAVCILGLHRSVRREDILKLKCQHAEQFVQLCRELTEKVEHSCATPLHLLEFGSYTPVLLHV